MTHRRIPAGEVPTSVVNARSGLSAWVRGMVEGHVGPEMAATSAQLVIDLSDAILCGDVGFDLMVKLLGGIRPASTWQGGRVAGSAAAGRLGCATGATAFEDAERAVRAIAPIIDGVFVKALGGLAPMQADFGLGNLLTATRSVSATSMREVFTDVLRSISTQCRRMRAGGAAPDWEATVTAAHASSLQPVVGRDAARETVQEMMRTMRLGAGDVVGEEGQPRLSRKQKRKERQEGRAAATEAGEVKQPANGGEPLGKRAKGGETEEKRGGGGGGGVKLEPLKPADVAAGSVTKLLTKTGAGAIEILDRLLEGAGVARPDRPCSWLTITGKCKNAGQGKCRACAAGGDKKQAPPAVIAALRRGCADELLSQLEPTSALRL